MDSFRYAYADQKGKAALGVNLYHVMPVGSNNNTANTVPDNCRPVMFPSSNSLSSTIGATDCRSVDNVTPYLIENIRAPYSSLAVGDQSVPFHIYNPSQDRLQDPNHINSIAPIARVGRGRPSRAQQQADTYWAQQSNLAQANVPTLTSVYNFQQSGVAGPSLSADDLAKVVAMLNNPALTITPVASGHQPKNHQSNSSSNSAQRNSSNETRSNSLEVSAVSRQEGLERFPRSLSNLQQHFPLDHTDVRSTTNRVSESRQAASNRPVASISSNKHSQKKQLIKSSQLDTMPALAYQVSGTGNNGCDNFRNSTAITQTRPLPTLSVGAGLKDSISAQLLQHIANHAATNTSQRKVINVDPNCHSSQSNFVQGQNLTCAAPDQNEGLPAALNEHILPPRGSIGFSKSSDCSQTGTGVKEFSEFEQLPSIMKVVLLEQLKESTVGVSRPQEIIRKSDSGVINESPDKLFIDRPKRIMSKIDMMIEKRKRRRFERISSQPLSSCNRGGPHTDVIMPQAHNSSIDISDSDIYESDGEISSDDEINYCANELVENHITLKEPTSSDKLCFLNTLGLLSKKQFNMVQIEKCSQRLTLRTNPYNSGFHCMPDRLKNLFDRLCRSNQDKLCAKYTDSLDPKLMADLECLNRSSSRIKLDYLRKLGLNKRPNLSTHRSKKVPATKLNKKTTDMKIQQKVSKQRATKKLTFPAITKTEYMSLLGLMMS